MSETTTEKIGADGFWKVLNEKQDASVIKQITPFSCVAAVGVMLLQTRGITMTQEEIIDIIGESSTTTELARLLNDIDKSDSEDRWHGVIVGVKYLKIIISKSSFGAVLREGNPLGHLVLVEKSDENLLYIKDPWDKTSYQMTVEEFLKVWNGEVILRWNLSK